MAERINLEESNEYPFDKFGSYIDLGDFVRGDRGTLQSEIELVPIENNGRLYGDIYLKGHLEKSAHVDCGILLGELCSSSFLFFPNIYNELCRKVNTARTPLPEPPLAVFETPKNQNSQDIWDILTYCWANMYKDEFKIWKFIESVINYTNSNNIELSLEALNFFLEISDIHVPHRRSEEEKGDCLFELYDSLEFDGLFDIQFPRFENKSYIHVYEVDSVPELALAILFEIVSTNRKIKACKQCGKLFIPTKSDEKYCNRRVENETCKDIANKVKRKNSYAINAVARKYNCINTLLANKTLKKGLSNEEIEFYENKLSDFRSEAKAWKIQIKEGKKTKDEYIKWLDSFKKGGDNNG